MESENQHYWHDEYTAQPSMPAGVSAFLAWLMIWLRVCLVRSPQIVCDAERWAAPHRYQPNRHRRRMRRAKIPRTRYYGANYILAGRHLTPRQFTEWQARYSGRGRVNVYRMPYWRKTVKGKAAPLGTEHEYWRDPPEPLGKRMNKLPCGIWAGHLWPGWKIQNLPKPLSTPRNASWVGIGAGQD